MPAGWRQVYEAIWDLFKMALTTRIATVRTAHLITGAPEDTWPGTLAGELFMGGEFRPEELCELRFPRGSKRTAWDDLLDGGSDRHPERVPALIRTTPVGPSARLAGPGGVWQLRCVRVELEPGAEDVAFPGGWPHGNRLADARHPALT